MVEADDAPAVFLYVARIVRDEDERRAAVEKRPDAAFAPLLEVRVADGHDLVDQEDVGADGRRDPEANPRQHPGRILVEGRVDEVADVREIDDVLDEREHLLPRHALEDAVEDDVVATGELAIEARAEREHHGDASAHVDLAAIPLVDAADERERRRLAAAILSDDADMLALPDREADVVKRAEFRRVRLVAQQLEGMQQRRLEAIVPPRHPKGHRHIPKLNNRVVHATSSPRISAQCA